MKRLYRRNQKTNWTDRDTAAFLAKFTKQTIPQLHFMIYTIGSWGSTNESRVTLAVTFGLVCVYRRLAWRCSFLMDGGDNFSELTGAGFLGMMNRDSKSGKHALTTQQQQLIVQRALTE